MKSYIYKSILGLVVIFSLTGCVTPAIHTAIHQGDINKVKHEVKNGTDINVKNEFGRTSLHLAASKGHLKIVKYLVESNATIDARDNWNCTPLYYAARSGNLEIMKYLVSQGANVKAVVSRGRNILYDAALFGHLEAVKYLKSQGLDINRKDKNGDKAIYGAVLLQKTEVVKYLIEQNADIQKDSMPLKYAIQKQNLELIKLLIENGSQKEFDNKNMPLHYLVKTPSYILDLKLVKYFVEQGEDINQKNSLNQTPLSIAKSQLYTYRAVSFWKNKYSELVAYLENEAIKIQNKKIAQKVNQYLKKKDYKGLKNYIEKNPKSVNYIKNPSIRLLFVGPKGLKVGDIKRYLKNGKSEIIVTSLIKRVKEPYKEFTIEEIEVLQKMGLSDKIISSMIDVTTKLYEKDELRKQNNKTQTTKIIYQNSPNQQQNKPNPVVDKVQDALIEEGVKMIFDRLF